MRTLGNSVAAVIVEPIAGNMGLILPQEGFLQTLREVTKTYGTVLIFDEVMRNVYSFSECRITFNIVERNGKYSFFAIFFYLPHSITQFIYTMRK